MRIHPNALILSDEVSIVQIDESLLGLGGQNTRAILYGTCITFIFNDAKQQEQGAEDRNG